MARGNHKQEDVVGKILYCLTAAVLLLEVIGCAGAMEQTIRPEDTAWIQNGQTTREQVIAKFGEANFVATKTGDFGTGAGEYVEYRQPATVGHSSGGGLSLEPRPIVGLVGGGSSVASIVYQPPLESLRLPPATGPAFWVLYDGQGVVKASGFGSSPHLPRKP